MSRSRPDLNVNIGGVKLRNPVLLASGTCGYGTELLEQVRFQSIGGLVSKSITLLPRKGNPMPRVAECTSGMLNAIGLENVGVRTFCDAKLPEMRKLPCALVANVAGSTPEEYIEVVEELDDRPELAGLELNLSCPNVQSGGMEFGREPGLLGNLVAAIRSRTRLPLWVKLTPNVTDIGTLARAAEDAGADALTVMNTLLGMRMDIRQRRPMLANLTGGLSGPAIKPVALRMVYQVAGAVSIPVIGVGGIETTEDVVEFLLAGAGAVQIGTATFRNPGAAEQAAQGLAAYLRQSGMTGINELIGAGRK
ncbi:dihydroorotate dehydrogenase [bacterium]|nr:dihydroorotate dehydrogenase [bacterium]